MTVSMIKATSPHWEDLLSGQWWASAGSILVLSADDSRTWSIGSMKPTTRAELDMATKDRAGTAATDGWTIGKLVVMGQGYVGLPLAVRAVEAGYHVVGYDPDKDKISTLSSGRSHIDDISDDDVADALTSGRFLPSASAHHLTDFDVAVISVPTPLRDGAPDVSYIDEATRLLVRYLNPGALVILESTTYPGTTEELVCGLLEQGSGMMAGRDFLVGYSPERIDPGNAQWSFRTTPKVVSGIDRESLEAVEAFYLRLVDAVVPVGGTREAEFTKLLENTFRHVNIALINELAIHARSLDIDIWDVIDAANTKPFGFMPFFPGPGVGGHCLPVDPSYLSWQFERRLGRSSHFVRLANDVNNAMPTYVAQRIQHGLNERGKAVKGSKVLILGLAYKKNTGDARETPSTDVIRHLLRLGATVTAHDPYVGEYELDDEVSRTELTAAALEAADVVVLVTDHDCFDYDLIVENAPYLFDTRNRIVDAPDRPGGADWLETL